MPILSKTSTKKVPINMKIVTVLALASASSYQVTARTIVLGTHKAASDFGGRESNVAWISGEDPCNGWVHLANGDQSPCGTRFTIGGGVENVHFEGCGGPL